MHKHLTWTDRLKIEKGLKEGLKPCAIADRLHVHNTAVLAERNRLPESNRRIYSARRNVDQQLPARDFRL